MLNNDFMFVWTATTADRFFRIDRAQEHLHYVTDISSEDLYILDPDFISPKVSSQRTNGALHTTTSNGTEVLVGPVDLQQHTVIVQDADCMSTENGDELKFTFSMPVTPPRSPG